MTTLLYQNFTVKAPVRHQANPRGICRVNLATSCLEQIVCSETSAHKFQTLGNHSTERMQHSEHGESLKSSIKMLPEIVKTKNITF
jgi:hypothetical protein